MNVKTVMAVAIAVVGVVALGGCGSMSHKGDKSALNYNPGLTDDVDLAYITRVNNDANEKGIEIRWVNPPMQKTAPNQ